MPAIAFLWFALLAVVLALGARDTMRDRDEPYR